MKRGIDLLKVVVAVFAIHDSSFTIHNSAWADSFRCGVETANKIAASTAPAAKGTAIYKAFEALKDDDFDEDEDREAAQKIVSDALLGKSEISSEDESTLRAYLYFTLAGIQPGHKGGWDDFELLPEPDKRYKFVEATKTTSKGDIKSAWKYEDGKCIWNFTIPEGTKATVCVNGMCKRYTPGTYVLEIVK